ncbi:iron complex outermembrane recepter protein [Pseudoalteromonas citrea]|uniref:Iron complex outermembrane recepter protein n=2 Tax=Pseudoalteromonas citrea TaxID=43655 RepID=A0AAD4AEI6_9GAMM|nr:TonB-dependent receptor [Pseudoalteromonas citrea]KAF7764496.1 iron complex outermembrane recepter protein [Pseudoalteromonas citrea]
MINRVALFFLGYSVSSLSVAQANSEEGLFELSFEELLDVNISLATKTAETRASVPSSITVFNEQHISLLGVSNAYDLMNFVPGFQSTRGDWVGAVPKEHARGVYLDSGNVLVMINGLRLNESSFGKASVYMPFIPVEIIERVEFIRGPGSALYGSNAFLGVMNVVTKKEHNQVSIAVGEHGHIQASLNMFQPLNERYDIYANVAWEQRQGEYYSEFDVRDPLDTHFIEVGIKWDKGHFAVHHNQTELGEFVNLAGWSQGNNHRSDNLAFNFSYQLLSDDVWKVTTELQYVEHQIDSNGLIASAEQLDLDRDFYVGPSWGTKDATLKFDASYTVDPSLVFNFGAEYSEEEQSRAGVRTSYFDFSRGDIYVGEAFDQGGVITVVDYAAFSDLLQSFDSYAIYGQAKYQTSDKVTLFIGARFDEVKHIDNKLSPRLAVIYDVFEGHTLKLQYGESFRTPVSNELNSNDDVTIGNPNLKSEYVKTTELVWHTQYDSWQADVVVFDNELEDFINLVPIDAQQGRFTFDNVFETSVQGMELNGNFNLSASTWFELGYTQLFDEPFNASFKRFGAMALTHQISELQYSLNAIWRDTVFVESLDLSVAPHFEQSAYFIIGASVTWQMSASQSVNFKAQNLFDKNYGVFDPRMPNGTVPAQGRNIRVQYNHTF